MTQFFLATNLEALTGRSQTSKVLTRVWKESRLIVCNIWMRHISDHLYGCEVSSLFYISNLARLSHWLRTWVSWFQTQTLPLYRLASIHGSVGWRSTLFTRSDLAVSLRLMSSLRGWKDGKRSVFPSAVTGVILNLKCILKTMKLQTTTGSKTKASISR